MRSEEFLKGVPGLLRFPQAIKVVAARHRYRDVNVRGVSLVRESHLCPRWSAGECGGLIEDKAGCRQWPIDYNIAVRLDGGKQRRAGRLNRDCSPKTAIEGITAAAHRAGVGLTDAAAERVAAPRAGAAAAINGEPVNGVSLGRRGCGK